MLCCRGARWRARGGQDIELAGEVGEGVHGGEADAEEGGLESGGKSESEEVGGERRRRERRMASEDESALRVSP